jgi:CYTH domain-containing protein
MQAWGFAGFQGQFRRHLLSEIDQATAAALGWPKSKYAWVERERRWLCRSVPVERVVRSEVYNDLYVTGTQLRLREAVPDDGGAPMLRLGRKADVEPAVRLLTSIYLSPEEFRLLSSLPGRRLRKIRHALGKIDGADVFVDVFEGPLSGLIMAEAEFDTMEAMERFAMPDFAFREVTEDVRYTGGRLVADGLPDDHPGSF